MAGFKAFQVHVRLCWSFSHPLQRSSNRSAKHFFCNYGSHVSASSIRREREDQSQIPIKISSFHGRAFIDRVEFAFGKYSNVFCATKVPKSYALVRSGEAFTFVASSCADICIVIDRKFLSNARERVEVIQFASTSSQHPRLWWCAGDTELLSRSRRRSTGEYSYSCSSWSILSVLRLVDLQYDKRSGSESIRVIGKLAFAHAKAPKIHSDKFLGRAVSGCGRRRRTSWPNTVALCSICQSVYTSLQAQLEACRSCVWLGSKPTGGVTFHFVGCGVHFLQASRHDRAVRNTQVCFFASFSQLSWAFGAVATFWLSNSVVFFSICLKLSNGGVARIDCVSISKCLLFYTWACAP